PAMILSGVLTEQELPPFSTIGFIALIAISCYGFGIILGFVMPKILRVPTKEKIFYNAMTVFSNYGYMGIPIVSSIFGTQYILYCTVFVFFNNVLIYTYGTFLFNKASDKNEAIDLKQMLINPGVISCFLALFIYLFNISLPDFINKSVTLIGDMTGALSMIIIGVSLAKSNILQVFSSKRLWLFAIIRLLIVPNVLGYIYKPFVTDIYALSITIVMLSMPVGSINIIYANRYDTDSATVSAGLLLTTILSVITVPLVIFATGI
ncbi:MAG: AEC family transporter, partial [Anaerotignaceae bacterium]